MHLADAFIQSDLQCIQNIHYLIFFISMCVPWELNPQPFALLRQCSTTEPQKHRNLFYRNFLNFFCINLKQEVEKTQKSAEAGCLKLLSWLNFFYL